VLGKGLVEVTAPEGALISIDGQSVGSAPVKEISVYEGKHRIQATLGGAKWQKSFSLGVNQRMFFNIETTAEP
jgi:serine/threonine-protein kinase